MMVIDGESGDELEDLTDNVGRSEGKSHNRAKKKKSKGKKAMKMPEVAVGSDAGDAEEMSCYAADDCDEFDDDSGYEPSIGPDVEDVEHDIEVEKIPDGGAREDDDDVIDVDEEDGSVRLSKRGALKNEARTKVHLLTHRYKTLIVSHMFVPR